MLVLSRKVDEEVIITTPEGTQIVVKIKKLFADRARIAFQAPLSFTINRKEVHEAIRRDGLKKSVANS